MNARPPSTSPRVARALMLLGVVAVAGLGVGQLALDDSVAVWTVALPIVALLAWATSLRRAGVVVLVGTASWVVAAALLAPEYLRLPLWYLNLSLRGAVMLLAVVLAAGWRRNLVRHHEVVHTDPVTGLANARDFFERVAVELDRALRYERSFTVVYVCLDELPQIVQRRGRDMGDELLRTAGRVIRRVTRGPDAVAVVRSAEFGILMSETGPTAAGIALARLRDALDAELRVQRITTPVSIGAVTWIRSDITVDQLLQRTYQMLYAAQNGAEDRCRHEVLDTAEVLL